MGVGRHLPSIRSHRSIKTVVCANAALLPFADDGFDLVTANMVVEHLDDPCQQFREVKRVLKSGGSLVFPHTMTAYIIKIAKALPNSLKRLLARVLEGRQEDDVFLQRRLPCQ